MNAAGRLLLIEDTPSLQMVYEAVLGAAGHKVRTEGDARGGLGAFRSEPPSAVLLDLMLPDRDGLDLMAEMLGERPEVPVIVITANGSINKAVAAMRAGAHDFLVKPFDEARLLNAVENALAHAVPGAPPNAPATGQGQSGPLGAFIGSSEPMRAVYAKIRSVARSMATVFITGESGTGKELCAEAVHDVSNRATGPFVPLNCGAIPSELLESEVFGHLRGSFTGAIADKQGAAAAADGGTLFLDEVCEMDLNLQTKLLRFLQTSTIQPVGATRARKVNVRIVCATNRDPLEAVRSGRFREDLYYRLHVVPIHLPPLRDRGEDVIDIAQHVLARYAREEGREFRALSEEVKARFRHHPWPGNVRQMLNVLRNVVVLNDGAIVTAAMLPPDLRPDLPVPAAAAAPAASLPLDELMGRPLAEVERRVIEATLALQGGSVPRAARVLDVSPSTLYRKIDAWARKG
ncbi:response regulator [Frigidibacter albus]|uniref:Nif-specific regulatory protein n=1 Tax=Frigidibacter albus TaxID=1465486 RepID=A0A6L8VFS9_9RHOB|nr:sigma-54 dependent transcriptional regulator [Frigidibacter albus]MZQ89228.1 response regulator [Frigidibacter albus]NBE31134.1 response regulator [Frigidibacter albus]GGH53056.1 sigma-54-dependent Fis family transcriptional regulator [Frigidibacter albus]